MSKTYHQKVKHSNFLISEDEMKEWYWNEELHDKTTDPLIIDDMTSNAITTIRRIASEFDGE